MPTAHLAQTYLDVSAPYKQPSYYGLTVCLDSEALSKDNAPAEVAFFQIASKLRPLGFMPCSPLNEANSSEHRLCSNPTQVFLCVNPRYSHLVLMHETILALQELPWLGTYTAKLDAFEFK